MVGNGGSGIVIIRYVVDTDGDGVSDAVEVDNNTDPNDPENYPGQPTVATGAGADFQLPPTQQYTMDDGSTVMIFNYDASNTNGQGQTEYTLNFPQNVDAELLIVGGGGAGANRGAGGGGGDALLYSSRESANLDRKGNSMALTAGTYTVVVGDGGTRPAVNVDASMGQSGKSSGLTGNGLSFFAGGGGHGGATLSGGIESASLLASPGIEHTNSDGSTSIGGGGGNYARASFILVNTNPAVDRTQGLGVSGDGGTGGDPSAANILYAGGGGGASSTGHGGDGDNGSSASGKRSGQGGRGIATDISGTRLGYGGGGGGGTWIGNANGEGLAYTETIDGELISYGGGNGSRDKGAAPQAGVDGRGGGSGGAATGASGRGGNNARDGGSGVVIIRFTPKNTKPGDQLTNEDVDLVISGYAIADPIDNEHGSGLTYDDIESKVTLEVQYGVIHLNGTDA